MWRISKSESGRMCKCSRGRAPFRPASPQPLTAPSSRIHEYKRWNWCPGISGCVTRMVGRQKSTMKFSSPPTRFFPIITLPTASYFSLQYSTTTSTSGTQSRETNSNRQGSSNDFRKKVLEKLDKEVKELIERNDLDGAVSALEKYNELYGVRAERDIYVTLLNAAVKANNKTVVEQALDYFKRYSIPYDSISYLCLLQWYSRTDQLAEVEKVWQLTKHYSQYLTCQIVTAMLSIIHKHKLGRAKLDEVLETMKRNNIAFDAIIYRELFYIYTDLDDMNSFTTLYKQYLSALSRGEVEDHELIWPHIINMYSLWRPPGWIRVVESALRRAKKHRVNTITYWEPIMHSLRFTRNTALFRNTLKFVAEDLGIHPTFQMFIAYCECIFQRSTDTTLTWLLEDKDAAREVRKDRLPPDVGVLDAWKKAKAQAAKYAVQFDSECYNIILAALAKSRNFDELSALLKELETNEQFTMNVYGYIAKIILTANMEELGDKRLEKVKELRHQAHNAPLPMHNAEAIKQSVLRLYETLLCAYAKLESPEVAISEMETVVDEMISKTIKPSNLHRTLYAFDMTKSAMDKLLHVLTQQWPEIQLDHRYYQPYFLVCMLDMVKRGEFNFAAENTNAIMDKMRDALHKCSQVFNTLNIAVFDQWAKLLAYYGDYNGVRASISLAQEEQHKSLQTHNEAFSWYWSSLIRALLNANKLDDAIGVLDEITASGAKPTVVHYKQLLRGCRLLTDMAERSQKAFSIYQKMLNAGWRPDANSLRDMLALFEGSPTNRQKVIEEAKRLGIAL